MTPDEINRTIAEDRGWTIQQVYVNGVPDVAILPPGVAATGQNIFEYAGRNIPNYLDEKNPGPAHELIEVLRGEGWRVRIEMPEHLGPKDYVRVELFRPSEQRGPYYASTFCRAVCESYLNVRGKWTD